MSSFKTVARFATQMIVSVYVSKITNKLVGQAFDRVFGSNKKSSSSS